MGSATSKKEKNSISKKQKKMIRQQLLDDYRPLRLRKNIVICGTTHSGKSAVIDSVIKSFGKLKKEEFSNFSYNMNKTFNIHEYVDQNVVSSKTLKYFDVFLQCPDINTESIDEIPQHIFHAIKSNNEIDKNHKCLTEIENELLFSGYFRNINENLLELKDLVNIIQTYYLNDTDIDVYGIGIEGSIFFLWELNIDYISNSLHMYQLLQNKTLANFVALIYIADLSCYDQLDDENVNEMVKSLDSFGIILREITSETVTILFLNKRDLFEQKIEQNISLNVCSAMNNEYKGPMAFNECVEFIRQKYEEKIPNPEECTCPIFTHLTVATDSGSMYRVFNDVRHIVINSCLEKAGLL